MATSSQFRYLLSPFQAYTPTAPSAVSDFPISRISDTLHPARLWKSAGQLTDNEVIELDFTTAQAIKHLLIHRANFTAVSVLGNTVPSSWGAPPFTQAETLAQDERTKHYQKYIDLASAGFNYRYMGLKITSTSTTDGETRFSLGTVIAATDTHKRDIPSLWPLRVSLVEPVIRVERTVGIQVRSLDNRHVVISLPGAYTTKDESSVLDLVDAGLTQPIVFYDKLNSKHAYVVRRQDDVELDYRIPDQFDLPLKFEEVI